MKSTDSKYREITAEQLREGYFIKKGDFVERREYLVFCKTERGTYMVVEPQERDSEKCEICGYPMDDGQLHTIPDNDTELCSHVVGR